MITLFLFAIIFLILFIHVIIRGIHILVKELGDYVIVVFTIMTTIAISSSVGLVLLIGCSLAFAMSIMRAARRTKYELSMELPLAEEAPAPVAAHPVEGTDGTARIDRRSTTTGRRDGSDGSDGGDGGGDSPGVVVVEDVQLESCAGASAGQLQQLLRSGSIKMTLAPVASRRASSSLGRSSMLQLPRALSARGSGAGLGLKRTTTSSFPSVDATSGTSTGTD